MRPVQRWLVLGSSVVVGATGLVYWAMDALLVPSDPWAVVNHPLQPWVLKLHVVSAPFLVFGLGTIVLDHVAAHLRSAVRKGRRSGIAELALLGPMVLSGYLIQVVTAPVWLQVLAWTHIASGVAYLVALGLHRRAVRRRRRPARVAETPHARSRPAPAIESAVP